MSENTYFAQLYVTQHDTTMIADARPSDALALALKFQAPIYVADAVLETAGKRADFAVGDERRAEAGASPGQDRGRARLARKRAP